MATFCPAPLDHLLAVGGAHALQEPVGSLSLALVWLVRSLHGARSLWIGEAGILCLMRLVVKYLIVLHVFCLAGVLGWYFAGVLLGLSVVGDYLETNLSGFIGPHCESACGRRLGGRPGMPRQCRERRFGAVFRPLFLWLIAVYIRHILLFLYSYGVIHRCGKSCV
jgi:hypothetical protein